MPRGMYGKGKMMEAGGKGNSPAGPRDISRPGRKGGQSAKMADMKGARQQEWPSNKGFRYDGKATKDLGS